MNHIEANELIDFYGTLLTDRQQQLVSLYYQEDYTITEIAELLGISRAAVQKNIKQAGLLLEQYEQKLKMAALYRQLQAFCLREKPIEVKEVKNLLESLKKDEKT